MALFYLLTTLNPKKLIWRPTSHQTYLHPHAPWWRDKRGSLAKTFDNFKIIPRALILSSFWHYCHLLEVNWLENITEEVVNTIEHLDDFGSGGGSDIEYTIHLAQAKNLPMHFKDRLEKRILQAVPRVVERDPEKWHAYCITPLRLAPTPDTLGADLIDEVIQQHLDYLIENQSPDGAWDPTWTWGDAFPKVWPTAKQEWRGHLTLQALLSLRAYGRIDR